MLLAIAGACAVGAMGSGAQHMALPSANQLRHMEWGHEMFIHFSITTYTGSQAGDQDPALFAPPPTLNVSQWVATAKTLNAPVAVLTAKHEVGLVWSGLVTHGQYMAINVFCIFVNVSS